jgi:hypothetical protein
MEQSRRDILQPSAFLSQFTFQTAKESQAHAVPPAALPAWGVKLRKIAATVDL